MAKVHLLRLRPGYARSHVRVTLPGQDTTFLGLGPLKLVLEYFDRRRDQASFTHNRGPTA